MQTSHITMYEKLKTFSNEKKINITSHGKTGGVSKGTYTGSLGLKMKTLLDKHGQTLKTINEHLSSCLSEYISPNTMYSWTKGVTPSDPIKANRIEQCLDSMIAKTPKIAGGTWCSREEVQSVMQKLRKHINLTEMHKATDVPIATIKSWCDGMHRVERNRFNNFTKQIEEELNYSLQQIKEM